MNKIVGRMLIGAGFAAFAAGAAQANLLVNGSFEETGAKAGSWFLVDSNDVPGWNSNVDIEIWDTYGLASFDGSQHAELNAGGSGPWSIWQDFNTQPGAWYQLSFAAAARGRGEEQFRVEVANTPFDTVLNIGGLGAEGNLRERVRGPAIVDLPVLSSSVVLPSQDWQMYNFGFTAAASSSRLTFTSVAPTGTMGNLLDDVSVVPAPPTLALFALGVLGVGSSLRQRARR